MERGEGACPPEEVGRLIRMRLEARKVSWAMAGLALAGLAVVGSTWVLLWKGSTFANLLRLPGLAVPMLLFAVSMTHFARSRGRHPVWGLLGLGFVLGWVVLYFLPPLCAGCGRPASRPAALCADCSGSER